MIGRARGQIHLACKGQSAGAREPAGPPPAIDQITRSHGCILGGARRATAPAQEVSTVTAEPTATGDETRENGRPGQSVRSRSQHQRRKDRKSTRLNSSHVKISY